MTTIRLHFDGKVFVPDRPVNLPVGTEVEMDVNTTEKMPSSHAALDTPLRELLEWVKTLPVDPDAPKDGAAEHDHYLYGTPKRNDSR